MRGFRGGVGGAVATVAAAMASATTVTTAYEGRPQSPTLPQWTTPLPESEFAPQVEDEEQEDRRLQQEEEDDEEGEEGQRIMTHIVDASNATAYRPAHAELVMAMNVGSDESYTALDGTVYEADFLFDPEAGHVRYGVSNDTEIWNTADDVLYRTEVWQRGSGVSYHVPVAPAMDEFLVYDGDYYVELHWAEIWPGLLEQGKQRQFHVLLEGQVVLNRFDIFATAGRRLNQAVVTTHYPVRVSQDGILDIETRSLRQNAKLTGWSLWRVGDMTPPRYTVMRMVRPATPMDPLVVMILWEDDDSPIDVTTVTKDMVRFVSTNNVEIRMEDFVVRALVDDTDSEEDATKSKRVEATWTVHPSHRRPWGVDVVLLQLIQHSVSDIFGNASPSSTAFVATYASNFDIVEPIVSIRLESPTLATDALTVRLMITDDRGLQSDSVHPSNVLFYGTQFFQVVSFSKRPLSVTMMEATWTVKPYDSKPWGFDSVTIVVVENSMLDDAGNGNLVKTAQYESSFAPEEEIILDIPDGSDDDGSDDDEEEGGAPLPSLSRMVLVKAVNCGSDEGHLDTSGHDEEEDLDVDIFYEADTFDNGNAYHLPPAARASIDILNVADDVIYHTERWSPAGFTYDVPVAIVGDYRVRLHFAENWFGAPRRRLFDVVVEGQPVARDLDIYEQVGGKYRALVLETFVSVTDGTLTISTIRGDADSPKLNAFSIWRQASLSPPIVDPIVPQKEDKDSGDDDSDDDKDTTTKKRFVAMTPAAAATAFSHLDVTRWMETKDDFDPSNKGEALLTILKGVVRVQKSNFGRDSFKLFNTGTKRIAALFIDVTSAIIPDVVFDDDGTGGDSVAKTLKYDNGQDDVDAVSIEQYPWRWLPARDPETFDPRLPFDPTDLTNVNNLFVDETSNSGRPSPSAGGGFRGELLVFTNFGPDKSVTFSGDMDPNSVAGLSKPTIDHLSQRAGFGRNFDVGGVSGAEMSGGVATVLFGDGSTASGKICPDGSQAGAVAVISNDLREPPELLVNGVAAGGFGTYGMVRPQVTLRAPPGVHVRVSMMKAFDAAGNTHDLVANGTISIDALVEARLLTQFSQFPVNNAVEWQHHVVLMPDSGELDISSRFNYHQVKNARDTEGPFEGHDQLALGYTAVMIDRRNRSLPISQMSAPIRLLNEGGPVED